LDWIFFPGNAMKSHAALVLALSSVSILGSPVEKVVHLIQSILERSNADGESETQSYNKFACWCETTSKRKAAAIMAADDELRNHGQEILSLKGQVATLTSVIEQTVQEIAELQDSQAEATSLREKQNAAFVDESTEMKQALAALQKAIRVLVSETSFLQKSERSSIVQDLVNSLPHLSNIKPEHIALLSEFTSGHAQRYAPQSVTIQGILADIYTTMARDLQDATSTEANQNLMFEKLSFQIATNIDLLQEKKLRKEEQKAEAESTLADTTQAFDDLSAEKVANVEFFDQTKESCTTKHKEWTLRDKMRQDEIAGLTEALKILSTDASRALFDKAIKPGKETNFLQESSEVLSVPVQKAYSALKLQATKVHSLRLAQVAAAVRSTKSGHFDLVITSIDKLIQDLTDENTADIQKRDQCKDTYLNIDSSVKDFSWKIKKNLAKIDKLESSIQSDKAEKQKTVEDIASVTATLATMLKLRVEENTAFKAAKKDDEDAVAVLTDATNALEAYFKKYKIELGPYQGNVADLTLLQQPFNVSEDQAPDTPFSGKGSRKLESKGVLQLLTMLIEDLKDEISNEIKNEAEAQKAYEHQKKVALKLRATLEDKKTNLATNIAMELQQQSDENNDMNENQGDKDDKLAYMKQIKPDCDWIIGAFKQRESARTAEMNGLVEAKEYLAGYQPSSLLQKSKFDDEALSKIKFSGMR